jgi:hypothetical protein
MAPQGLPLSLSAAPICENRSLQAWMTRACPASPRTRSQQSHWMENEPNLEAKRRAPAVSAGLRSNAYRMATGLRMKWIQEFLDENLGLMASTTTPMSEQSGHNGCVHHREVGLDARCVI